jgi:CelD/BcsL family acetyltransferase involved in cellulose biosynthesis
MTAISISSSQEEIEEAINQYKWLDSVTTSFPPSLRPYWLRSYLHAYGRSADLLAVQAINEHGGATSLAPLVRVSEVSVEFMTRYTADYSDVLTSPAVSMEDRVGLLVCMLRSLVSNDVASFTFARLSSCSVFTEAIKLAAQEIDYIYQEEICDALPYIDLRSFDARRHQGELNQYRRKRMKLLNSGVANFAISPVPRDVGYVLSEARKSHIKRWRKVGVLSSWATQERHEFIELICKEAGRLGALFIPTLWIDDNFAAMRMCFIHGRSVYEWMTTFNCDYSAWSPGSLLLDATLDWLLMNRPDTVSYEFLRGRETWKKYWTNEERRSHTIHLSKRL